jgi:hypothetical protein
MIIGKKSVMKKTKSEGAKRQSDRKIELKESVSAKRQSDKKKNVQLIPSKSQNPRAYFDGETLVHSRPLTNEKWQQLEIKAQFSKQRLRETGAKVKSMQKQPYNKPNKCVVEVRQMPTDEKFIPTIYLRGAIITYHLTPTDSENVGLIALPFPESVVQLVCIYLFKGCEKRIKKSHDRLTTSGDKVLTERLRKIGSIGKEDVIRTPVLLQRGSNSTVREYPRRFGGHNYILPEGDEGDYCPGFDSCTCYECFRRRLLYPDPDSESDSGYNKHQDRPEEDRTDYNQFDDYRDEDMDDDHYDEYGEEIVPSNKSHKSVSEDLSQNNDSFGDAALSYVPPKTRRDAWDD